MQRHIPLGYCVAQGKAEIERKTSQIVQDIYTSYDNEASCNAIAKDLTAKGILTANQKPSGIAVWWERYWKTKNIWEMISILE